MLHYTRHFCTTNHISKTVIFTKMYSNPMRHFGLNHAEKLEWSEFCTNAREESFWESLLLSLKNILMRTLCATERLNAC